ncbi:MAG: DNA methyltransferase, partial [candidate division WOR-3 bacterium]
MIEKYKLILGDCLQKMKELPSESVDAVITDPPYNVLSEIQAWDDKGDDDKFLDFTKKWMSEAYRV